MGRVLEIRFHSSGEIGCSLFTTEQIGRQYMGSYVVTAPIFTLFVWKAGHGHTAPRRHVMTLSLTSCWNIDNLSALKELEALDAFKTQFKLMGPSQSRDTTIYVCFINEI